MFLNFPLLNMQTSTCCTAKICRWKQRGSLSLESNHMRYKNQIERVNRIMWHNESRACPLDEIIMCASWTKPRLHQLHAAGGLAEGEKKDMIRMWRKTIIQCEMWMSAKGSLHSLFVFSHSFNEWNGNSIWFFHLVCFRIRYHWHDDWGRE